MKNVEFFKTSEDQLSKTINCYGQLMEIIKRHSTLREWTFVRLQIAQRRNFFERGINTVRWARLRHRHTAVSLSSQPLCSLAGNSLCPSRTRGLSRLGKRAHKKRAPLTNVAHWVARPTDTGLGCNCSTEGRTQMIKKPSPAKRPCTERQRRDDISRSGHTAHEIPPNLLQRRRTKTNLLSLNLYNSCDSYRNEEGLFPPK